MAGVGRFKLSDAIRGSGVAGPGQAPQPKAGESGGGGPAALRSNKAKKGRRQTGTTQELAAEQLREARESARAKNAEASIRGRMVEIGRGNQQAGRQQQGG
jgi:hypothetical protein